MRRLFTLSAALGVLAFAATTYAGTGKPKEAWASGRIERVDASAKSVVLKQGTHEMTFVLAPEAHLMQGKKALQPGDLVRDVGSQVTIRYTTNGTTKLADRIEVADTVPTRAARTPGKS